MAQDSDENLQSDLIKLREYVNLLMEESNVPGLAMGIVKDGKVFFAEGFGYTKSFVKAGPFGSDLDVGPHSSPTMADWDVDGDLDLLVGNSNGNIQYYENIGTSTQPSFNGHVNLTLQNGSTIDVGYEAHPDVADWDDDGVIDIITGEHYGTVLFFKAIGPLSLSDNQIDESAGGSIAFSLNAGTANANRNYLILGGLTGTEPGFPLPVGFVNLPLNWDVFTDLVLALANSPVFSNFMGQLNNSGEAAAKLNAPPLPGFAGTVMHFA
jgi:hypothetical protein